MQSNGAMSPNGRPSAWPSSHSVTDILGVGLNINVGLGFRASGIAPQGGVASHVAPPTANHHHHHQQQQQQSISPVDASDAAHNYNYNYNYYMYLQSGLGASGTSANNHGITA